MTLARILEAAAERNPSGDAAVAGTDSITYAELDARSSALARLLVARGLGAEDRVALAVTRSIDLLISLWAVTKCGAAFVPIDPNYPRERIEFMLSDSGVTFGATTRADAGSLPESVEWLVLDRVELDEALAGYSTDPLSDHERVRGVQLENTAYIIYTSGSTGRPKGVVVTHGGLETLASVQRAMYSVDHTSRVLQVASPSFDASILELLLAAGGSAPLVLAPPTLLGGEELAAVVAEGQVSHAFITPGALNSVDAASVPTLQHLMVGGEAFSADLVSRWAPNRNLYNAYGPTETTCINIVSSPLQVGADIPLGSPLRGVSAYVLDTRMRPVPSGVTGELYLTGPALAAATMRALG